jgi:two-component system LytT family sensor kinase
MARSKITLWLRRFGRRLAIGFCICTAIGLFFAYRFGEGFSAEGLRAAMPRWYVWGALTPLILWVDRRIAGRSRSLWRRLVWHLPFSLFWAGVHAIALYPVKIALASTSPSFADFGADMRATLASFQWVVLVYWAIVGAWAAWDYYNESRARALRTSELERSLTEARLLALQTQLQPHFLFNALNTISAFVERDPRGARRMIEHLGDLLRLSLVYSARQETALEEELETLEHFVAIQRVRFEDRLEVTISVEPDTRRAAVPCLILQPLVENAIRHGASQARKSHVAISAARDNGNLRLLVADDGPGLPAGWHPQESAGIGISNTRQRLAQLYPDAHSFSVRASADGGVTSEVIIPYREV